MNVPLTHVPLLTLPKLGEPFEVVNDASLMKARTIMLQVSSNCARHVVT